MVEKKPWVEPYKIKVVEPLKTTTPAYRERAIKTAGWNTCMLRSEDIYIDLFTDSGTNAMSDYQWAGMMMGDEAYIGSKNFYHFEENIHKFYGYKYVVPTHQGRGAEHLLSMVLIKPGQYVAGNMYFITTLEHQELAGGIFADVITDEAKNPHSDYPFKGNVDLDKFQKLINEKGSQNIAYITIGAPVNMAGGQPISMANMRAVSEMAHENGIRVVLDVTRNLENAYFIKTREKGYADKSIAQINKEFCMLSDACTCSAKKDLIVNIGGFVAVNDEDLFDELKSQVIVYEGLYTYGGLAGRDLEAMTRGIEEASQDDYMRHRISQVKYFGDLLLKAGVPIVTPIGGHAVFLDAKEFYPQIPQEQFPAQKLAADLYVAGGIRGTECGTISAGRDKETGENIYPELELVRLAIPRRVYTQSQFDYAAECIIDLYAHRDTARGLKFVFEPKKLRFFQSRFELV